MIYDCIIVGAGASGLFCSAAFPTEINGLILEKTKKPGTKLLMSGAGQCNITHSGSIKNFISMYGKNGSKIRSCLYKYNNLHLQDFLCKNDVPTWEREDGKIFPKSMRAKDIRDMLLRKGRENGFSILYNSSVTSIVQHNSLWQVCTNADSYLCKNLVIAAGGCSFPQTGSDGSIFKVLTENQKEDQPRLDLAPLRPALTPVNVASYPYSNLSGISFKNAGLSIWRNGKLCTRGNGPLLFTHENFSGPLILNFSKVITKNDKIVLNYLYPSEKTEILDKINYVMQNRNKQLIHLLANELKLPKSFLKEVIAVTCEKPKAIAEKLTADTFTVTSPGGYQKAMVTAGGIALSEINCKTMECSRYPGLFIIGEVLDIDGATGGYNLQFAYSSACAASNTINYTLENQLLKLNKI